MDLSYNYVDTYLRCLLVDLVLLLLLLLLLGMVVEVECCARLSMPDSHSCGDIVVVSGVVMSGVQYAGFHTVVLVLRFLVEVTGGRGDR